MLGLLLPLIGGPNLNNANWTDADSIRARRIWADYQALHDIARHLGETVGIDPSSGRVWFGETALDVTENMNAAGVDVPLYCVRVGQDYYVRKAQNRSCLTNCMKNSEFAFAPA